MRKIAALVVVFLALVGYQPSPSGVQQAGLKAGWTGPLLSSHAEGCVQGIVTQARKDYEAEAAKHGASGADFPEQELKASVEPMCSCLSNRAAESWEFATFMLNQKGYFQPLVEEAMSGGRCKPEGLLGEILEHARKK